MKSFAELSHLNGNMERIIFQRVMGHIAYKVVVPYTCIMYTITMAKFKHKKLVLTDYFLMFALYISQLILFILKEKILNIF